jgi:hypothetical protein
MPIPEKSQAGLVHGHRPVTEVVQGKLNASFAGKRQQILNNLPGGK